MSVSHGDMQKQKPSGGRKRSSRKKRRFEHGSFPAETILAETKRKVQRRRGGGRKIRLLRDNHACVTDPKTMKTEKTRIERVLRNPANIDYDRRGVITKGAIIETAKGPARVTSRPGQDGVVNAVLTRDKERK